MLLTTCIFTASHHIIGVCPWTYLFNLYLFFIEDTMVNILLFVYLRFTDLIEKLKIVMKYLLVNTFLRKANSKFYCQPIICQTSNKHWKFTYFRIYFEQVSSRNSLFFKLFQGYGTLQVPLRLSEFPFRNMKCQNGNFLAKSSPGPTKTKKTILSETWVRQFSLL